jgi:hypothetical protein
MYEIAGLTPPQRADPFLSLALDVHRALANKNHLAFFKSCGAASKHAKCLLAPVIERERERAFQIAIAA